MSIYCQHHTIKHPFSKHDYMSQNNGKKYISSALQLINSLFAISPLPLNVVRSFFANVDEILVALTYLVYTPVFMEIILLLGL